MKFSKYPDHVRNLYGYHWKPLLIAVLTNLMDQLNQMLQSLFQEFLQEHNAIFYIDAHISWNTGDLDILQKQMSCNLENPNNCNQYPLMLLWYTGHSIFATTKEGNIFTYVFACLINHNTKRKIFLQMFTSTFLPTKMERKPLKCHVLGSN